MQRGHGCTAQFGLGHVKAEVGARVDQAAAGAGQQVSSVVAGIDDARARISGKPPALPGGARRADGRRRAGGDAGEGGQVTAQLVTGDDVGMVQDPGEFSVGAGDEVLCLPGGLDVDRGVVVVHPGQAAGHGSRTATLSTPRARHRPR